MSHLQALSLLLLNPNHAKIDKFVADPQETIRPEANEPQNLSCINEPALSTNPKLIFAQKSNIFTN